MSKVDIDPRLVDVAQPGQRPDTTTPGAVLIRLLALEDRLTYLEHRLELLLLALANKIDVPKPVWTSMGTNDPDGGVDR